ncbi:hypothetical protein A2160_01260 [Candidatus Beckwithbacteria bacterium RBG_13_42_9]|uniref:Four helix bundle protein n=1 Tax=Candidatus Beckwithbacteria bacterium RBG_13_42_9 TaxID=1797457 RepID=A0A1F5E4F5_9BACT|nr:MAG: hypothetical protein A2160_01260 [Candidatus Beckwithbacteria bacterium RBG_13_42_9]
MNHQHWTKFSLIEQLANIGSEVERTILWRKKNNPDYSQKAFERSLELLDLTLKDSKNCQRLRELARLREVLVDYFWGENLYSSSDSLWQKYFLAFAYKARRNI